MENNKSTLDSFKHSFIKVPRKVLDVVLSFNHPEYAKLKIYLFLLSKAYYLDGIVHSGTKQMVCHRGEYIGIYKVIAKKTQLSTTTVRRYIKELQDDNLISIVRLKNALRFTIISYDELCGVAPAPAEKKPSRAPKPPKEKPAMEILPAYLNPQRPMVYDDNMQLIRDPEEAQRIMAEREKKNNSLVQ